jgi:hypothetical protein
MSQRLFKCSLPKLVSVVLCIALLAPAAAARATFTVNSAEPAAMSQAASATSASGFYNFDVIAKTGDASITDVGEGVSIQ